MEAAPGTIDASIKLPEIDDQYLLVDEGVPAQRKHDSLDGEININDSHVFNLCPLPPSVQYRAELVDTIADYFAEGEDEKPDKTPRKAIIGVGGAGKSTVAALFAHSQLATGSYDFIHWMPMDSEACIRHSWLGFARDLGIDTDRLTDDEIMISVYDLIGHYKYLLIFDNVSCFAAIESSLQAQAQTQTQGPRQHVLITSCDSDGWGEADSVLVGGFEEAESVAFVRAAMGDDVLGFTEEAARQLHVVMGGFPLALSLAVGYMRNHSSLQLSAKEMCLSQYVSLFNWQGLSGPAVSSAEAGAAQTAISLWRLTAEDGVGQDSLRLMTLISMLCPDHIPAHLLEKLGGAAAEVTVEDAVKPLLRGCWLSLDAELGAYSVHRLAREAVRAVELGITAAGGNDMNTVPVTDDIASKWLEPLATAILGAFPANEEEFRGHEDLDAMFDLHRHTEEILKLIEKLANGPFQAQSLSALCGVEYELLMKQGWVLLQRQRPGDAGTLFERALELCKAANSGDHSNTAAALLGCGLSQYDSHFYVDAAVRFEESLGMRVRLLGDGHPAVAEVLDRLGSVYQAQGTFDEALKIFKEAMAIRTTAAGNHLHSSVAQSWSNIGSVQTQMRDLAGALTSHKSACAIRKSALGPEHPLVGSSLVQMGVLSGRLGHYLEAVAQLDEALWINKHTFGPNHHGTAAVLISMGSLQSAQGMQTAALESFEAALDIHRHGCGTDRTRVADVLRLMGTVYRQQSACGRALDCFCEARRILVRAYGKDSVKVAEMLTSIGFVHSQQETFGLAAEHLEEALRIRRVVLGADALPVVDDLLNLGGVLAKRESYAAALEQYEEALRIRKLGLGVGHADTATTLVLMATVLEAAGLYDQAVERHEEALAVRRALRGDDHPTVALAVDSIAAVRRKQGMLGAALEKYEEAVEIRRRFYPPNASQVSSALEKVGGLYKEQGQFATALQRFEDALKMRTLTNGQNHPEVAAVLGNIGGIQLKLGRAELAVNAFVEALRVLRLVHGADSARVGNHLMRLGRALLETHAIPEAIERFEEALKIRRVLAGTDSVLVADTLMQLALAQDTQGPPSAALPLFEEALEVCRRVHGPDHPFTMDVLIHIRQVFASLVGEYCCVRRAENLSPVGKFSGAKKQAAAEFLLDFVESAAFTGVASEIAVAIRAHPRYHRYESVLTQGRMGVMFRSLFRTE